MVEALSFWAKAFLDVAFRCLVSLGRLVDCIFSSFCSYERLVRAELEEISLILSSSSLLAFILPSLSLAISISIAGQSSSRIGILMALMTLCNTSQGLLSWKEAMAKATVPL